MLFSDCKTFRKSVDPQFVCIGHEMPSEEEEDRTVAKVLSLAVTHVIGCSGLSGKYNEV